MSREQGGLAAAVPSTSSELRDGSVSERLQGIKGTATAPVPAAPAPFERRNIFDDETLDFSRLRLGKDESTLPQLGNSIPDHLRDSILRLVETQKEEAEAEARAIAEARGGVYLPQTRDDDGDDLDESTGDGAPSLRTKGGVDGDDSDAEEETGDKIVEVGTVVSRRVVSGWVGLRQVFGLCQVPCPRPCLVGLSRLAGSEQNPQFP